MQIGKPPQASQVAWKKLWCDKEVIQHYLKCVYRITEYFIVHTARYCIMKCVGKERYEVHRHTKNIY